MSHPGYLQVGGSGADVGIEAAPRSGDGISGKRTGCIRIILSYIRYARLDPIHELLAGRAEIRAARCGGIVAIARCRWAALKVFGPCEVLAYKLRADQLTVA